MGPFLSVLNGLSGVAQAAPPVEDTAAETTAEGSVPEPSGVGTDDGTGPTAATGLTALTTGRVVTPPPASGYSALAALTEAPDAAAEPMTMRNAQFQVAQKIKSLPDLSPAQQEMLFDNTMVSLTSPANLNAALADLDGMAADYKRFSDRVLKPDGSRVPNPFADLTSSDAGVKRLEEELKTHTDLEAEESKRLLALATTQKLTLEDYIANVRGKSPEAIGNFLDSRDPSRSTEPKTVFSNPAHQEIMRGLPQLFRDLGLNPTQQARIRNTLNELQAKVSSAPDADKAEAQAALDRAFQALSTADKGNAESMQEFYSATGLPMPDELTEKLDKKLSDLDKVVGGVESLGKGISGTVEWAERLRKTAADLSQGKNWEQQQKMADKQLDDLKTQVKEARDRHRTESSTKQKDIRERLTEAGKSLQTAADKIDYASGAAKKFSEVNEAVAETMKQPIVQTPGGGKDGQNSEVARKRAATEAGNVNDQYAKSSYGSSVRDLIGGSGGGLKV